MGQHPERIHRPALEHSLVSHCNLACARCDHASPISTNSFSSAEAFNSDIRRLSAVLRVDSFRFTGGEPLLHPNILPFLDIVRDSGLAGEVGIWTNGLLLESVDERVLSALNYIRITTYPGVRVRRLPETVERIKSSFAVRVEVTHQSYFFETRVAEAEHDVDVRSVFLTCKNSHEWSCHSVSNGRYYKCSRAPVIGNVLRADNGDGVEIHGNRDLRQALEAYLRDENPLHACRNCLGTSGPRHRHHQMSKADRTAWARRLNA